MEHKLLLKWALMKERFLRKWGFVIAAAISFLGYAGLVQMQWRYGTLRDAHVPETIGWYSAAFIAYVLALIWIEKHAISLRWVWGLAVVFRLLMLLTTPPTLSDDVYRYLWDGHVANQGVSPYAHAIESPELDYLTVPVRAQANNAWMASPYLPVAQLVFWGITAVLPLNPLYLQITMILFELTTAWMLSRLLHLAQLPAHRILIYLWNPLIIIEVAHSAHLDAWMIFLALLAVKLTIDNCQLSIVNSLPPFFLALATLTKPLPILIAPILFWRWTWSQRIAFGLLTVGLLIPFGLQAGWGLSGDLDGTGLFGALRIYTDQWNFNSGVFHWMTLFLGKQSVGNPADAAKLVIGVVMVGVETAVFLIARTQTNNRLATLRLMIIPFMAYVLLTPTLHPWYILILLTFMLFLAPTSTESKQRWWLILPWLYLSYTLIFSYLTYLDPFNHGELEWVRQLEWLPTLGLLITAVFISLKQSRMHHKMANH